jgi:superfamily II DNA or RNA helicase
MLRPYQQDALARWQALANKRLILAHATSAGKTLTSIECAKAINAKRILVVCPAVARPTWVKEFAKWGGGDAQPVIYGRGRKALSKAKVAARDAAYGADIQVVSYTLLREIDANARDIIILDEIHALRDPLSKQSKIVRAYFKAHPTVAALGLSATPIPTEVKQIWNPLDTFWPKQFGAAAANGGVSWGFCARYCYRKENEYGVKYSGSRSPEALADLGARIAPYIHRVTDAEVAPYLPPLHAEPLYLDEHRKEVDVASDWLETAVEATHVAVICFNRETAREIAAKLGTDFLVTGEDSPEARQAIIDAAKASPSAILVASSESVRESISLSFCKRALILQWRTSPAAAIQLMGRFPRQDADNMLPCYIQYAVLPGDETRAETLSARIKDIQSLMKADRKSERLVEIFSARPLTEERLDKMFTDMFSVVNSDPTEWSDADEW